MEQLMLSKTLSASQDQATDLAQRLANHLHAGDCILLIGEVGAGKTHFARQIILHKLSEIDQIEDVPSPTFTLVQTYDVKDIEIWHADLYRLSDPNEAFELGLEDAFETQICLVEWPDRLGAFAPKDALSITFETVSDTLRAMKFTWQNAQWTQKINTMLQVTNEF
jgi:tRNA threonylcarbamoyladenosine biosynthesis protein TsaE